MPPLFEVDAKGTTFTYMVALHVSCSYMGVSNVDWLSTTTDGTSIAAGYLRFVVAPNPSVTPRVGTVSLLAPFHAPVTITFTQSAV